MEMDMKKISLQEYDVYVGDVWDEIGKVVDDAHVSRCFVLVDSQTREACLPLFLEKSGLTPDGIIEIEAGEIFKTIGSCQKVWQELIRYGADRNALLVNLGGGVIGDLGGFAASSYKRGIRFVQVPTTLLSQLDASIGGKVGIDFAGYKNIVGAFSNPLAVFIDPAFYDTLSDRQLKSGYAEALKHALIADQEMWHEIKSTPDLRSMDWVPFLEKSLLIKKEIVEADPMERGARKALNFGHTIGHAIESVSLESDKPLLHGEAVILGMIAEAYIAVCKGLLSAAEEREITHFLSFYVDFDFTLENREMMYDLIKGDKKNEEDRILCTLLSSVGEYAINQEISLEEVEQSLNYLEEQFDRINA